MSDLVPSFAYSSDLVQRQAETETSIAREWRRDRRSGVIKNCIIGLLTALLIGAIVALAGAVPNIRFLPVFLWINTDGTVSSAMTTDSVPALLADDVIKVVLWNYVRAREEYSWIEADYNHYVVEAMSAKPVADSYDAWSSGKNPQSYLALYGKRCIIKTDRLDEDYNYQPALNGQVGHYAFRFKRLFQCEGEKSRIETWTVSLGFVQNYKTGLKIHDIKSFNPARIIVTDYPGATQLAGNPAVTGVYPR